MPLDSPGHHALLEPLLQQHGFQPMPSILPSQACLPAGLGVRFSRVLRYGVTVWMRGDNAMALLSPENSWKIHKQPFETMTLLDAGILRQATRVIMSVREFPDCADQQRAEARVAALLKLDREGGLAASEFRHL